jgi:hypothetical protein
MPNTKSIPEVKSKVFRKKETNPMVPGLSLIDDYLLKMMDNPTINYLKRLFQEEEDSSATDGKE